MSGQKVFSSGVVVFDVDSVDTGKSLDMLSFYTGDMAQFLDKEKVEELRDSLTKWLESR